MGFQGKFVIEFGGIPEGGKSTLIEHLRTWFIHYHETFPIILADMGKCSPVTRVVDNPSVNNVHETIWIANKMLNNLISAIYGQAKVIIVERGPIDMAIFSMALEKWPEFGKGSNLEFVRPVREYLRLLFNVIDVFVLIEISWQESYARETRVFKEIFGATKQRAGKQRLLKELQEVYQVESVNAILDQNGKSAELIHVDNTAGKEHISLSSIIESLDSNIKLKKILGLNSRTL